MFDTTSFHFYTFPKPPAKTHNFNNNKNKEIHSTEWNKNCNHQFTEFTSFSSFHRKTLDNYKHSLLSWFQLEPRISWDVQSERGRSRLKHNLLLRQPEEELLQRQHLPYQASSDAIYIFPSGVTDFTILHLQYRLTLVLCCPCLCCSVCCSWCGLFEW